MPIGDAGYLPQTPAMSYGNTVTVALENGDFTDIQDALDSITDASLTNPYTINWYPGVYSIDNPIVVKSFISIRGIGQVIVIPQNPTLDVFQLEINTFMSDIAVSGATSGRAFVKTTAGNTLLENIQCIDCQTGIYVNNINANLTVRDLTILTPTTTTQKGCHVESGQLLYDNVRVSTTATITELLLFDGSDVVAGGTNIRTASSNVTTGITIKNGARSVFNHINIVDASTGILVQSGSNVVFSSASVFNCNIGFQMDDATTRVTARASNIEDSITLNAVLNGGTLIATGITSDTEKIFADPSVTVYASILDLFPGDESLDIFGELHVGSPARPAESCLGEGDSYVAGMLVYTETSGGVFTDVTDAAKSVSGSTFTFPGTGVNNSIYVGSQVNNGIDFVQHYGIKTLVETAAVYGSGEIIIEFWNGSSWEEENGMEVDASGRYFPHAKDYFQITDDKHIRYNNEIINKNWTKNDPMSLGVNYYWSRFRISSAITTAPVFQQWKVHSSRFEIDGDGFLEYFGRGRPRAPLPWHAEQIKPAGSSLADMQIWYSDNLDIGMEKNALVNGGRATFNAAVPDDMDTSTPVQIDMAFRPDYSGTFNYTIRWTYANPNTLVYKDSSAPGTHPNEQSVSGSISVTTGQIAWISEKLDFSESLSRRDGGFGDILVVGIEKTNAGDMGIMVIDARYTKWCEGEHI